MPPAPIPWHAREAAALLRELGSDAVRGLAAGEAAARLARDGPNELPSQARRSPARMLAGQFTDFMIVVLLAAAGVSGLLGEAGDAIAIVVIVVVNALVGFAQEYRAERAMQALRRLAASDASVLRDGARAGVPAARLVVGDVVLLEAGAIVPADLRLLDAAQLRIDESLLTGESVTVDKHCAAIAAGDAPLAERFDMAYRGTAVAQGRGTGVVVAVGARTELGRIAALLQSVEEPKTPLQKRLAAFGRRLGAVVIVICAVVFAAGIARGEPPVLMFLTAVSLAVAAIPEALPAVVTILLALGARRMVRENALVRHLPAVETLGSVSCICSDKTGTLTLNRMTARALHVRGRTLREWHAPSPGAAALLEALVLDNDASVGADGTLLGDPTETALVAAGALAGLDRAELDARWPRAGEIAFDSERKRMTTIHRADRGFVAYTKGAPESVIERCERAHGGDGDDGGEPFDRERLLAHAERMAADGMRVLAVARRDWPAMPARLEPDEVERGLAFVGLVGMIDPPRPEARDAVRQCVSAGIVPVMITGDHPATARAIARELGVLDESGRVMTGAELARLDDAGLLACVDAVRVFARVDPAQKIRIVSALQSRGRFVAMTGDGVNDAPALRRADIGVAMGRDGAEVAREASSLVLLDDNFATIVAAVREGRRIHDNVRKFVRYAMTGNSAEVWTVFAAPLLGMPIPLLPIHILWVNLVTDGLPGLALAAEPAERGVMRRSPRPAGESLFAHGAWQSIVAVGLVMAAVCLLTQAWALATGRAHWQTMVFTVLTLSQLSLALALRSERESLLSLGVRSNLPMAGAILACVALQLAAVYVPVLNPVFRTAPLDAGELVFCVSVSAVPLLVVELEKFARRRRAR